MAYKLSSQVNYSTQIEVERLRLIIGETKDFKNGMELKIERSSLLLTFFVCFPLRLKKGKKVCIFRVSSYCC